MCRGDCGGHPKISHSQKIEGLTSAPQCQISTRGSELINRVSHSLSNPRLWASTSSSSDSWNGNGVARGFSCSSIRQTNRAPPRGKANLTQTIGSAIHEEVLWLHVWCTCTWFKTWNQISVDLISEKAWKSVLRSGSEAGIISALKLGHSPLPLRKSIPPTQPAHFNFKRWERRGILPL